jgi:hypothetical protein
VKLPTKPGVYAKFPLAALAFGEAQARIAGVDHGIVAEYQAAMEAGDVFPALDVFFDRDGDKKYRVADGEHRGRGAILAPKKTHAITLHIGDRRAAVLFAVGANAGLGRKVDDKRNAVGLLLSDEEWCAWSDREIARRCRVSPTLVGEERRRHLSTRGQMDAPAERTFTRAGATHTMRTDGINATRPKAEPTRIVERIEVPDDDGWVMPAEDVTLLGEEGPDYEEGPGLPPDAADDEGPSGLSPSELNEHISRTLGEAFAEKLLTDEPWRAPAMPERAFAAPSFRAALANCVDDINGYLSNAATVYRHMKTLHEEAFAAGKVTEPLESFIPSPLLAMAVKFSELASMARQACDALIIAERAA